MTESETYSKGIGNNPAYDKPAPADSLHTATKVPTDMTAMTYRSAQDEVLTNQNKRILLKMFSDIWKYSASHIALNDVTDASVLSGLVTVRLVYNPHNFLGIPHDSIGAFNYAWACLGVSSYALLRLAREIKDARKRQPTMKFLANKDDGNDVLPIFPTKPAMQLLPASKLKKELTSQERLVEDFNVWFEKYIENSPLISAKKPALYAQAGFQTITSLLNFFVAMNDPAKRANAIRTIGVNAFGVVANLLLAKQPSVDAFEDSAKEKTAVATQFRTSKSILNNPVIYGLKEFVSDPSLWIAGIFLFAGGVVPHLSTAIDYLTNSPALIAAISYAVAIGMTVSSSMHKTATKAENKNSFTHRLPNFAKDENTALIVLATGCFLQVVQDFSHQQQDVGWNMVLEALMCGSLWAKNKHGGVAEWVDSFEHRRNMKRNMAKLKQSVPTPS